MSMHVFHDIFLHVVWHTKDDEPILTGETEAAVHRFLRQRCAQTKGVFLHAIGGTHNHVHLVLSIEPFVNLSDLIGDLKGASSRYLNRRERLKALYWQRGYGVVSFGRKNLPFVLRYVANQREHHAKATIRERLETAAGPRPRGPEQTRPGRGRTGAEANAREARLEGQVRYNLHGLTPFANDLPHNVPKAET